MLKHYCPLARGMASGIINLSSKSSTRHVIRVDVYTLKDLGRLPLHREPVAVTHVKDGL